MAPLPPTSIEPPEQSVDSLELAKSQCVTPRTQVVSSNEDTVSSQQEMTSNEEVMLHKVYDVSSADSCFESQGDSGSLNLSQGSSGPEHEEFEFEGTMYPNKIIKLNISGTVFMASLKTLTRFPNTRLAKLSASCLSTPSLLKTEHYFERNPAAFADIIEYYRTGELHMDQGTCGAIFKEELKYWGLERSCISMCCWSKYDAHRSTTSMFDELDKLFDDGPSTIPESENATCWSKVHFYVFQTLENPSFSIGAKVFVVISILVTFVSIFQFVAETHYVFQQIKLTNGTRLPAPTPKPPPADPCQKLLTHLTNHSADETLNETHNETALEHSLHDKGHIDSHLIFHYLDIVTFSYFVAEILVRFIFTYNRKQFFRSPLNIVEVICIGAHFSSIIEHKITVDADMEPDFSGSLIILLRSLRIMRVARIFKLFRHMSGFKVLVYTIVVSIYELLLIISFLFAGVLIFASIIHYVEEKTFPNIPFAIWWALVTMTTVGYGDVTPKSDLGYFIGAMCVIAGILVIAFTVPVVVNNFTLYYTLCKSRQARLKVLSVGLTAQKAAFEWKKKALSKSQDLYG